MTEQNTPETVVDQPEDQVQEGETQEVTPTETDDQNEPEKKGETPSIPDQNVEDIIGGWKEDRERLSELENENFELKQQVARSNPSEKGEEDLSFEERVDAEIKRRDELASQKEEMRSQRAENEIKFMERTNPTFRENKDEILKLAVDSKVDSLLTAVQIFEANQMKAKQKIESTMKDKKKNASNATTRKPRKSSGNSTPAKSDGDKHINDIYRDELL